MKKLLLLSSLIALPCTVLATSQVTLYGKIDESVLVGKLKGNAATVQEKSGFTAGSRWGLKGLEDLGNGYKVGFILESGFDADTGAAADDNRTAFNRESALFMEGGFGKVTVGRLGTLGFAQSTSIRTGWAFGVTHGGSAMSSSLKQAFGRADNSIAYASPSFSGLSLHLMYSNAVDYTKSDDAQNKWSKNNHYYGIGARFKNKELTTSLIYERVDNKNDPKVRPENHITFGGQYKFPVVTPMVFYQYSWQEDNFKQHTFALSGSAPVLGGTASLGIRYILAKQDGSSSKYVKSKTEDKGTILNIGGKYSYKLSKRTSVYGYAGWNDAKKAWASTEKVLYNGWQAAVGMVHDF